MRSKLFREAGNNLNATTYGGLKMMNSPSRLAPRRRRVLLTTTLLASSLLVGPVAVRAAEADSGKLEEIVVTAQKRTERLQDVPIAVQALGESKLEDMAVKSFDDYVKLLPSVSYQSYGPGQSVITMRGIASGGDGAPAASQPTVGVYVDEIPTTQILGQLDFHIYDVARVEALSGPQGTLYGASSESGTLKIITNPPDPKAFSTGYEVEVNSVQGGGIGHVAQGFVNVPLSDKAALRAVVFEEHDAGYIDNVPATRTYPTTGYTVNNASVAKKDYNDSDSYGGRLALKIDLDDEWTIQAGLMSQDEMIRGINAFDTTVGDLAVGHYFPEKDHDRWFLPSLTVTGKVGNLDLTYAAAYLVHDITQHQDYTDYSYFYDALYGFGSYATGPGSTPINIGESLTSEYRYRKISQELRLASPADNRLRVLAGLFYQRQTNDITANYQILGVNPTFTVTGWPGDWWLSREQRIDRDYAAFANGSFDVLPNLTVDGGVRVYRYDNTLEGFFGSGANNPWLSEGESKCISSAPFMGAPCSDIDNRAKETNAIYKATVTYKFDADRMIYFTASDGYRPGGANRNPGVQPYQADTLNNYEVGWKTSWFGNKLRWNGDLFYDPWTNFQFNFLGLNAVTSIVNAGHAVSEGIETDLTWKVTPNLTLSAAGSAIDAHLTAPYCGTLDAAGNPVTECSNPEAPKGTQLPVTPYVKANFTGRYDFDIDSDMAGYLQSAVMFTGGSWADMRSSYEGIDPRTTLGRQPAYTEVDFSAGAYWGQSNLDLYVKNAFNSRGEVMRYSECAVTACGSEIYVIPIQPRIVGLKFGQKF